MIVRVSARGQANGCADGYLCARRSWSRQDLGRSCAPEETSVKKKFLFSSSLRNVHVHFHLP